MLVSCSILRYTRTNESSNDLFLFNFLLDGFPPNFSHHRYRRLGTLHARESEADEDNATESK